MILPAIISFAVCALMFLRGIALFRKDPVLANIYFFVAGMGCGTAVCILAFT